jgi:hypothetical protein
MNEAPFTFQPAQPKGQQVAGQGSNLAGPPDGPQAEPQRRTRRTAAQIAAEKGEKQIDPFDAFDRVFGILAPLPKGVRDRILSTLGRIYD